MLIDTHVHLSHYKFENNYRFLNYDRSSGIYGIIQGDRDRLIEEMRTKGIGAIIEPAIDIASNHRLLELAEAHHDWIFPAVGLHPTRTYNEKWKDRAVLKAFSKEPNVIAIGETGLDFHYPRQQQHRFCQVCWFVFQILLAHRQRLPLILHIREANEAAIPLLRLFRPLLHGGVTHCFYGDFRTAQAFIGLGFCLGIGGTLLQDNESGQVLRETVRQVPLEWILLETDAPYVHPTCDVVPSAKMRSKVRNTSLILPAIAEKIAELRGIDTTVVERQTTENANRVFRIFASAGEER